MVGKDSCLIVFFFVWANFMQRRDVSSMIIRNSSVNMAAQSDYSSETSSTHLSLLKRPGTKSVLDRNYLSDYSGGVSDGLNSEKGSTIRFQFQ